MLDAFTIGFWHPFGPHGGESPEEILTRKQKEIAENGWTLWSFQLRTNETLLAWYNIITAGHHNVKVFCSEGKGTVEPKSDTKKCSHYRMVNEVSFSPIPEGIQVPHPLGSKGQASAFVVENIIYPLDSIELCPVEWYKRADDSWKREKMPTRPEYLIRRGGDLNMRRYRAVLILKYPYLAVVGQNTKPVASAAMV
jgi:hypothetical protein